jgi:predicted nucleotidyltransferase
MLFVTKKPLLSLYIKPIFEIYIMRSIAYVGPTQRQGRVAREDQREDSDVDILVEIEPQIGLGFVELADRIEDAIGVRTEVVSRRAIKPRYWEIIKEDLVDVP